MSVLTNYNKDPHYTLAFGIVRRQILKHNDMLLIDFLRQQGAVTASKVVGPNGAFISYETKKGAKSTLPVGKKSQAGKLAEFNVVFGEIDNQPIATISDYSVEETLSL